MNILLAGASGFLGTALRRHLTASGHTVEQLVRRDATLPGQHRWDPYGGQVDPRVVEGVDTVINLAGAAVAHWPWTASYKRNILDSRTATTGTLADAIAASDRKPALVNASGVGYYGPDRGDELLDEESPNGPGFLAGVVRDWEAATSAAAAAGARVVKLRTAIVLDHSGGALEVMGIPFRFAVGGQLGSGQQWFPTVSLTDYLAVFTLAATSDDLSGVYNVVAPEPATNREFTKALGHQLGRPTIMRVPALALKATMGDLSGEFLGSLRVRPVRLLEAGFTFAHPTIESQLRAAYAD